MEARPTLPFHVMLPLKKMTADSRIALPLAALQFPPVRVTDSQLAIEKVEPHRK